jgi:hypothetical protein
MATLAISDELFERVARIARARSLPVDRQVEEWLTEAIDRRSRSEYLRKMFDEIASLTPPGVNQTDSIDLLRQDRGR